MHRPPRDCPVCGTGLSVTRLTCSACDTEVSGDFAPCEYCALDDAERELLSVFLRSRGNMREIERHLGVSYPTARARFDDLLSVIGLASARPSPDKTATLEALSKGEIDVDEALRRLG